MERTYNEVMTLAADSKLTLDPSEKLQFRHVRSGIYEESSGGHMVADEAEEIWAALHWGKLRIQDAPTVNAAIDAAGVALKLRSMGVLKF